MTDPYSYPGTDILINLEGIKDPSMLARYEARACANRMLQLQSERQVTRLSLDGLCDIHRAIFQDLTLPMNKFRGFLLRRTVTRQRRFRYPRQKALHKRSLRVA